VWKRNRAVEGSNESHWRPRLLALYTTYAPPQANHLQRSLRISFVQASEDRFDKVGMLLPMLRELPDSARTIIFVKNVGEMEKMLLEGLGAGAQGRLVSMHAHFVQSQVDQALADFISGKLPFMISSDEVGLIRARMHAHTLALLHASACAYSGTRLHVRTRKDQKYIDMRQCGVTYVDMQCAGCIPVSGEQGADTSLPP
jgi:superfamily II DNA/RNA helicase